MNFPMRREEAWRPQFHFSPQRNWINDPNGLVYFDGEYHLFYQYNPQGATWGHMSWGHAVSADLVNWTELPVAIPEDERAMVFSGSVVVDTQNSSGFGRPGIPAMVACFTACLRKPAGRQVQDLAFSLDRGRTWTRHAANPVLEIDRDDFRDPKVFWHAATQRWVMVVVVPDLREVRFYGSTNLRNWSECSRFNAPFEGQGIWECPDLLELPSRDGRTVWMLKVDALGGHPSGDTGARIFFGHFDGYRFLADPEEDPRWADGGSDFYASLSWNHLPGSTWSTHPVWLAWMSCHRYANQLPTQPWRGAMSLPRRLLAEWEDVDPEPSASRPARGRWHLIQEVVASLETLREPAHVTPAQAVRPDQTLTLWSQRCPGLSAEVQWSLEEVPKGVQALLCLVVGDTAAGETAQSIEIGFDADRQALWIDRSQSGFLPPGDDRYAGRRSSRCRPPREGRPLSIRIWWDWSSVEILADDGRVCLTELILPSGTLQTLIVKAHGGDFRAGETTVWPLRAAEIGFASDADQARPAVGP